jgi:flagellar M-ring protein FliF
MDQLRRLITSLTLRQKVLLGLAAPGVLFALFAFLQWQRERNYVTLYESLASEDAAAIVAKLKESGTEFRLSSDGSTVRVGSDRLAEIRLQLAAAGLPKTGRIGFELFDRNNFGTTEFVDTVNYYRALEGELERTVMSIAAVEHARIHITPPKDSVFLDQRRLAKASVLLRLRPQVTLSAPNVKSITHLVSSAVQGLAPETVSVLDDRGNLLTRPKPADPGSDSALNDLLFEYKNKIERDLLAKVNNTLEPLLGPERYRAAVSVDCDLATTDQSEESFDPSRSVMATSQRAEDVAGAAQPSGVPGTASNLPRPTSRPTASGQTVARRTENITYQSSRLVKRTHMPQGNVKRLSVSVLLDHSVRYEGSGAKMRRRVEPPSPERIKATRDLVAGVVGLQAERGDQLIVEALPFESTLSYENPSTPMAAPPASSPANPIGPLIELLRKGGKTTILVAAGAGFLLLLVILFIFFRVRSAKKKKAKMMAVPVPALDGDPGSEAPALPAGSDNSSVESQFQAELSKKHRKKALQEQEVLSELAASAKLPSSTTTKAAVLVKHITEETRKNPEAVAQLVRTWLSDSEG